MTYYIMMDGDKQQDTQYSSNILGEESFGMFYPDEGMNALMRIVDKFPELLSKITIIGEDSKKYTLTEFFDIISPLKIRKR